MNLEQTVVEGIDITILNLKMDVLRKEKQDTIRRTSVEYLQDIDTSKRNQSMYAK